MLHDVELCLHVGVPIEDLNGNKLVPKSLIVTRLLKLLLNVKTTEKHGYFLSVTGLKNIGKGKLDDSNYIGFPVTFMTRTFLPVKDEVMTGVVQKVRSMGLFLKYGPMNYVYLSAVKMPNYQYVPGENPVFCSDTLSRIETDVVVRFKVFAMRWTRTEDEREIMVLATLEGDSLGPISLAGSDEMEL